MQMTTMLTTKNMFTVTIAIIVCFQQEGVPISALFVAVSMGAIFFLGKQNNPPKLLKV